MKTIVTETFKILKKNLVETKNDLTSMLSNEKPKISFPKLKMPMPNKFSTIFEETKNKFTSLMNEVQEELKSIKFEDVDTGIFETENGVDFIFDKINPKTSTLKFEKNSENEITIHLQDTNKEDVFERKTFSRNEPFEIKSYSTETTNDRVIVHVLFA